MYRLRLIGVPPTAAVRASQLRCVRQLSSSTTAGSAAAAAAAAAEREADAILSGKSRAGSGGRRAASAMPGYAVRRQYQSTMSDLKEAVRSERDHRAFWVNGPAGRRFGASKLPESAESKFVTELERAPARHKRLAGEAMIAAAQLRERRRARAMEDEMNRRLGMTDFERALGISGDSAAKRRAAAIALQPGLDPKVASQLWEKLELETVNAATKQSAAAASTAGAAASGTPQTAEEIGRARAALWRARMSAGEPAIPMMGVRDPNHLRPAEVGGELDEEMRAEFDPAARAAVEARKTKSKPAAAMPTGGGFKSHAAAAAAAAAGEPEVEEITLWHSTPEDAARRKRAAGINTSAPATAPVATGSLPRVSDLSRASASALLEARKRAAAEESRARAAAEGSESAADRESDAKVDAAFEAMKRHRRYSVSNLEASLEEELKHFEARATVEDVQRAKERFTAQQIAADDIKRDFIAADAHAGPDGIVDLTHMNSEQYEAYARSLSARVNTTLSEPRIAIKTDKAEAALKLDAEPTPEAPAQLKDRLKAYKGAGRIERLNKEHAMMARNDATAIAGRAKYDYDLATEAWIRSNEERHLEVEPGELPISDTDVAAMNSFYTAEMTRAGDPNAADDPPPYDPELGKEIGIFFRDRGRTRTPRDTREAMKDDPMQLAAAKEEEDKEEFEVPGMLRFDEFRRASADPVLRGMLTAAMKEKPNSDTWRQMFRMIRDKLEVMVPADGDAADSQSANARASDQRIAAKLKQSHATPQQPPPPRTTEDYLDAQISARRAVAAAHPTTTAIAANAAKAAKQRAAAAATALLDRGFSDKVSFDAPAHAGVADRKKRKPNKPPTA